MTELAVLAMVAWALWPREKAVQPNSQETLIDLIRELAEKHGVPLNVALAFAWIESGLDPSREGDLDWATKKPAKYVKLVRDNPARKANPYRLDARAWHSYGLYQLHAAHHTRPNENPRVLLDPEVNADRGLRFIAKLLGQADGDPLKARLAYVGCGLDGSLCSSEVRDRVRSRLIFALERYRDVA